MQAPSSRILETVSAYLPRIVLLEQARDPALPRVRGRFVAGAVLFADISGFTAMSERLSQLGKAGAEEVTAILNRCFTSLLDVLFAHGGDVLKFGGDALTAFFPGDERQASVAVQAALRMQAAMRAFEDIRTSVGNFRLEMRVGINWGRAFLAEVGTARRMEGVCSGAVVNRTAEAEAAAKAGEVAVTAETFARLGEGFEGEPVAGGFHRITRQRQDAALLPVEPVDFQALAKAGGVEALKPYLVEGLYEKVRVHATEIEGEHRLVTVLFVHFWGIDYEGDPQAVEKLNRYVTLAEEVAHRYGGVLNKVDMYTRGDKLMVLFGAPAAHENDEERAVRCALDLRAERAALGLDIHHRFGINAGHVFAGIVGSPARKEYTVMGDAVNLAARLMASADEGQVLVSESVRAKTARRVVLNLLGQRPMKGKKAPVSVYEAVALQGQESRPVRGGAQRLVGREREVEQMRAAADRALAGTGQVLTVVGQAGVGKSRLVEALIASRRARGVTVHAGACPSYGGMVPYAPWSEILKALLDIQDGDRVEDKRERLIRGLAEVDAHLASWAPILDDLIGGGLPDTPLTAALEPEQRKAKIFEIIRDLVGHRAARTPLALVFEDVHWMDDLSWELLDAVAQEIPHAPLLLVAVSRPDPRLSAWDGRDHVTAIPLTELPEAAAQDLIAALLPLPEIPQELFALILAKSQGNPFFIEEIVRTLVETGAVREQDGALRVAGDLASLDLPDTIQGVIMSRIDRLEEGSRSVVKVASVLGRRFRYSFLRGIYPYGADDGELRGRLAGLSGLDMLLAEGTESYFFKHILIQEVAYDSLPFARRKALHHDAGRHIEATFSDAIEEHLEILAYHYGRTDDEEKSLDYLMRAGAKTKRLYANQTAIAFYTDALRRLEGRADAGATARMKIACHTTLGDILKLTGRYPEALEHYGASLSLSGQVGDRLLQAGAMQGIGQIKGRVGKSDEALRSHTEGLRLVAEAGGDRALEGGLLNDVGTSHFRMGDYEKALTYFERSLAIRRELGDRRREAFCEMNMGTAYGLLGDPTRAVALLEQACRVFQEVGDREMETRALANLSDTRMDSGDYQGAEEACLKAVEILEEIGDRPAELMMLDRLGGIDARLGDYTKALARFQQVLTLSRQIGEVATETVALNNIGQVHWQLGNYRQALDACQAALDKARACEAQDTEATTLHTLGLIAASTGDASAALERFQEAERIADEVKNSALQAHVRVDLGRRLLSAGKGEEAVRAISAALDQARQAGCGEVERYGQVSLAVAHRVLGDFEEAGSLIAEVRRQNAVIQHKETEVQLLKLEGEMASESDRPFEALGRYNAALELARSLRTRKEEGWVLRGAGNALRRLGDEVRAVAHHREAVRLSVEMGDRPLQEKLLADLLDFERDLSLRGAQGDWEAANRRDEVHERIAQLRGAMALPAGVGMPV